MNAANDNSNPNKITNEGGHVRTIEGPKAINAYRIKCLMLGMKLWLETGMQPNRMYTPSAMAEAIGRETGKTYARSRKGKEQAYRDIVALWQSGQPLEGIEING